MNKKKIYLIGAGPGDLELLTLKALKLIEKADVILYDALVNPKILDFCKEDAHKVNVGKRKDRHLKRQEEINDLLVNYAKDFEVIVRLKGGTPFVFGRGYEEVRSIVDAGYEPVIIPGVSSTTAVPESFMIPLVDRKFNDAYRTVTGHDIKLFNEIVTNFHERENLVIMMGIYNLQAIVSSLLKKGFPKELPIAILSKGTTPAATRIVSTLEQINQKDDDFFEEVRTLTPAILFIGYAVNATTEAEL